MAIVNANINANFNSFGHILFNEKMDSECNNKNKHIIQI